MTTRESKFCHFDLVTFRQCVYKVICINCVYIHEVTNLSSKTRTIFCTMPFTPILFFIHLCLPYKPYPCTLDSPWISLQSSTCRPITQHIQITFTQPTWHVGGYIYTSMYDWYQCMVYEQVYGQCNEGWDHWPAGRVGSLSSQGKKSRTSQVLISDPSGTFIWIQ